jgi:hypothetical protein
MSCLHVFYKRVLVEKYDTFDGLTIYTLRIAGMTMRSLSDIPEYSI